MPRHARPTLGETEMEFLQHVWDLGHATVGDVHQRVLATRTVAYTTVMTVLKRLAKKGFLECDTDGTAYVYHAARNPEDVRADLVRGLLDKAFGGSRRALVQTLVRAEPMTEAEAAELARIVEDVRRGDEPDGDQDADGDDDA